MENKTNNDFVQGLFIDSFTFPNGDEMLKTSFKAENFIEWLKANTNDKGYVNVDFKKSKAGKWYAQKNTFIPKSTNPFLDE